MHKLSEVYASLIIQQRRNEVIIIVMLKGDKSRAPWYYTKLNSGINVNMIKGQSDSTYCLIKRL